MSWADAAFLGLGLLAVVRAVHVLALARRIGDLPECRGQGVRPPSLSIVVAARDEEVRLEGAARSWLGVDVPDLEVIVVDDRSTDRTPQLLDRLAAEDERLQVLHLSARPEGWLGKCHALREGAARASGRYLLFTDADVALDPSGVRRALLHAERARVDHLVLIPRVHADGPLQRALNAVFFQTFLSGLGSRRTNLGPGGGAIGVGAFGLVRRQAYESVGGHEPIRMQVGDDVALARLLLRAGHVQRVHWGEAVAAVHWQQGTWGTVRGIEKNWFWGVRFSLALQAMVSAALLVAHVLPLAAAARPWPVAAATLTAFAASNFATHLVPDGRIRTAAWGAVLHPLAGSLLVAAGWLSAIATLRRGGIVWRGDFVPLEVLRRELKPLSWWFGRPPGAAAGAADTG